MQDALAGGLAFPGGDDHAGVGDGNSDAGDDLGEGVVVDTVVEGGGVDVVGVADTGDADGVRAYAESGFQVLGVHKEGRELIAVEGEAEEDA